MKTETALGQRPFRTTFRARLRVAVVAFAVSVASTMADKDALFSQAAGHLLRQDFKAAQETVRDAVHDEDSADAKRLQEALNTVAGMPEVLLGYFRANIGKELSVPFRDGTKFVRKIDADTRMHEDKRGLIREFGGKTTGVVRDDDAFLARFAPFFGDIGVKAGGRFPDRIRIHAIRPRSDYAAKAAGSECEVAVEPIFDLGGIPGNRREFTPYIFVKIRILTP